MPKATKQLLTTRELCGKLKIHRHTLEKMVKDGLPIAGKKATRGRASWLFDADAVAGWAIANGRDIPAITGEQIKSAMVEQDTTAATPATAAVDDAEPITLQLQAERSQYQKLFARFLQTHAGDDAAGVAGLAKAITIKSDALRRLELSVVEYQRKAGDLVNYMDVQRKFVELASGTRERVMAVPNIVIPSLRPFLKDPDDAGKVKDLIDDTIRHALTALPATLPEMEVKQ